MSIHVISAVLNCRDKELTSSRRMVLVCLANYAGEDGRSWPSQQLIADESGCGLRSVKDHLKWLEQNGFIARKTKSLGQGNGSCTSYHISLSRLTQTQDNASADFAGANNARAKSGDCEGSIPPLTNRQEPSVSNSCELDVTPKRKAAPKGEARGKRITENWAPTPKDYAFASGHGLTREEINREADRFRNYWLGATGRNAAKRDWEATWRNWLTGEYGIVTKRERAATEATRPQSTGQSGRGGLVAAGLRHIGQARGYGEPLPEGGGMGAGYVIDREAS